MFLQSEQSITLMGFAPTGLPQLRGTPTSRIKTVRAGERDCPQDNPLSKRVQNFDLRLVLALFLYIVVASFVLLC